MDPVSRVAWPLTLALVAILGGSLISNQGVPYDPYGKERGNGELIIPYEPLFISYCISVGLSRAASYHLHAFGSFQAVVID